MKTILIWSTSDVSHVRMRNLMAGLENEPVKIIDVTIPVWKAEQNKALLGIFTTLWRFISMLLVYPILAVRYLFAPDHDLILVPYMGPKGTFSVQSNLTTRLFCRMAGL